MANYEDLDEELERAVREEKLGKVKALLSAGANVNLRVNQDSDTLLHITYSVEITRELLLGGAYVNATNMYRETPLHHAVKKVKELEIVKLLLKHGANVNATHRRNNTALTFAAKKNDKNLEVIKELLKYGADINIRSRERGRFFTPLEYGGNGACGKLMIKYTLMRNFNKDYKKIIDLSPDNIYYNERLSSYLDDCVCEIVQMKTDENKDGLTLYEFLTKNFSKHALCNNQLSVKLAKIDYSVRYPIYNDIILDNVKPFLEKADLLNKLSKIQFYTQLDMMNQDVEGKKIILDYDSTYNISEYLSNDDLLNLITAFDESKECTIRSSNSSSNPVEPKPSTKLHEVSKTNDAKRIRLEL